MERSVPRAEVIHLSQLWSELHNYKASTTRRYLKSIEVDIHMPRDGHHRPPLTDAHVLERIQLNAHIILHSTDFYSFSLGLTKFKTHCNKIRRGGECPKWGAEMGIQKQDLEIHVPPFLLLFGNGTFGFFSIAHLWTPNLLKRVTGKLLSFLCLEILFCISTITQRSGHRRDIPIMCKNQFQLDWTFSGTSVILLSPKWSSFIQQMFVEHRLHAGTFLGGLQQRTREGKPSSFLECWSPERLGSFT